MQKSKLLGIMSPDIIPARSEAQWPSTLEGVMSEGHGIMSPDIIPARSEAQWPSTLEGVMSEGHGIMLKMSHRRCLGKDEGCFLLKMCV